MSPSEQRMFEYILMIFLSRLMKIIHIKLKNSLEPLLHIN